MISKLFKNAFVTWLCLCGCQPVLSAVLPPGITKQDAAQMMPVDQIKRGMRGYGLTVFQGTQIEKFKIEILGVLKKANTGKDFILIRAGDNIITKRQTGIIAGMSGSPCYINGRLIGAVSYSMGFSKEPIGMVTPIYDMLEAWDANLPKRPSGHSAPTSLPQPIAISGKVYTKVIMNDSWGSQPSSGGVLRLQRMMTPVMVAGMSQRGISRLSETLTPLGLGLCAGPGGGHKVAASPTLGPGAAVGVSLAVGDIDMTGVGTVTYRNGERLVAFGHPMLGIGATDAPMSTAYVEDVVSSYNNSFKIASPLGVVGRIYQDRPWSVAGKLGVMPMMIPFTMIVENTVDKRKRTFHVNVIDHPLLTGAVMLAAASDLVYQMQPNPHDTTATVSYEIDADQVGVITRSNTFFDGAQIDSAALADFYMAVELLRGNRFYPLDIRSAKIEVKLFPKRATAIVDRVYLNKSDFQPGETIDVGVVLRPYKGDRLTKICKVTLPSTVSDGRATLVVRGGNSQAVMAVAPPPSNISGSSPSPPAMSELANADNVKQLFSRFLKREKNNDIVIEVITKDAWPSVNGVALTGMPEVLSDVMKSPRSTSLRFERGEIKSVTQSEMLVDGAAQIPITIARKSISENRPVIRESVPGIPSLETGLGQRSSTAAQSAGEVSYDGFDITFPTVRQSDTDAITITAQESHKSTTPAVPPSSRTKYEPKQEVTLKESPTEVKAVARPLSHWVQDKQSDFAKGEFENIAATSKNELVVAPTLQKLVGLPGEVIWCLLPTGDGVLVGTGNSGKVYKVSPIGDVSVFFSTGEVEVQALTRDSTGTLYAGTAPNGKIFKISANGSSQVLCSLKEHFASALVLDPNGTLYAGAADSGKIYKISTHDGSIQLLVDLPVQNVLCLTWDPRGHLLAGTGPGGILYTISSEGLAKPLYDADSGSITSMLQNSDNSILIASAPKGDIVRLTPDNRIQQLYPKATRTLAIAKDRFGRTYAAAESGILVLLPDDSSALIDNRGIAIQYTSVAVDAVTGMLYAGASNPAAIYVGNTCVDQGTYESAVHDAKVVSKWAKIKWAANTTGDTSVGFQTRTGDTAEPNITWSPWSTFYATGYEQTIDSPSGRYVQYRAVLRRGSTCGSADSTGSADSSVTSPKLSRVEIAFLTTNKPPKVNLTSPTIGDTCSRTKTVKWEAADPDKDVLDYVLAYSTDGIKWTKLAGTDKDSAKTETPIVNEAKVADKVKTEVQKSADIPDDLKNSVATAAADTPKSPSTNKTDTVPIASTSYSWDTTKVPDGVYHLKVSLSDRPANAEGFLSDEATTGPFVVCNIPPSLTALPDLMSIKQGDILKLAGEASSALVEITGVQFRVDEGMWLAAAPTDGLFDSLTESYYVTASIAEVGKHKVEVQAVDTAGNSSTMVLVVEVT